MKYAWALLVGLLGAGYGWAQSPMTTVLDPAFEFKSTVKPFYGAFSCMPEGAKDSDAGVVMYASIGDTAPGPDGKSIRQARHVGFVWGNQQKTISWGKPRRIDGGAVRLIFPDRKPVVLKLTRPIPTGEYDYDPFFSLTDEGSGRAYRCAFSAE
jgi:hypothetical protein